MQASLRSIAIAIAIATTAAAQSGAQAQQAPRPNGYPVTNVNLRAGPDHHLREGLNVHNGEITHKAVAEALHLPYVPASEALKG